MLTEVPLPRLLAGIASALRTHVEPNVDDEFARMQLRAIDEALRNLSGRVEWSMAELTADIEEREAVLGRLGGAGWTGGPSERPAAGPAFTSPEEALEYRTSLIPRVAHALIWAQAEGPQAARAIATEFLRAANDRERELLESGMYA